MLKIKFASSNVPEGGFRVVFLGSFARTKVIRPNVFVVLIGVFIIHGIVPVQAYCGNAVPVGTSALFIVSRFDVVASEASLIFAGSYFTTTLAKPTCVVPELTINLTV